MLEAATNRHTGQLKEIFAQAGKLYGSEIDRQEQEEQRNLERATYMPRRARQQTLRTVMTVKIHHRSSDLSTTSGKHCQIVMIDITRRKK